MIGMRNSLYSKQRYFQTRKCLLFSVFTNVLLANVELFMITFLNNAVARAYLNCLSVLNFTFSFLSITTRKPTSQYSLAIELTFSAYRYLNSLRRVICHCLRRRGQQKEMLFRNRRKRGRFPTGTEYRLPAGLNQVFMFPSSTTAGHRELSKASEKSIFMVLIQAKSSQLCPSTTKNGTEPSKLMNMGRKMG